MMDKAVIGLLCKAEEQKSIKAEIVLRVLKPFYEHYLNTLSKHKEIRNSELDRYNKHTQLMKHEIKKLKEKNRQLQKELNEAKLLNQ